MRPSQVARALRQIAMKIDNSKSPNRELVARDLKRVLSRVAIYLPQVPPDPDMPDEVKEVAEKMLENAKESIDASGSELSPDDLVYVGEEEYGGKKEWHVGPNIGNGLWLIWKPDEEKWYTRQSWSELPDKEMKNGQEEALANAAIYFTG